MPDVSAQLPPGWEAPALDGRGNGPYRLLHLLRAGLVHRFARSVGDPTAAQREALERVLRHGRGSGLGARLGLDRVRTLDEYRRAVPIRAAGDWEPDLSRAAGGDPRWLTTARVRSFAKTSGTTGAPKLLPVTDPWAREVAEAQALWVIAMVREQEEVVHGRALTSVGPAVEGTAPGGLPYGSNTGRMQLAQPWLVRRRFAVPYEVHTLADPDLRAYCALRLALPQDVRTWTTANPSTVLAVARGLRAWADDLAADLADGTLARGPARDLDPRWRHAWRRWLRPARVPVHEKLGRIWKLAAINCWKGGPAPFFLDRFPEALGAEVRVREVGITASEGYFALPLHSSWSGGVAWAAGHLLELVSGDHAFGLDEVEIGREYRLVISTTAGLYRYDLNDVVRVVGRYGRAPVLAFVGKGRDVHSVTGEKVTAEQVALAMRGQPVGAFSVGVRLAEVPWYVLASDGPADAAAFDRALRAYNPEYDAKRASGRLGAPVAERVPEGTYARWRADRLAASVAEGQVKDPLIVQADALDRLLAGWR